MDESGAWIWTPPRGMAQNGAMHTMTSSASAAAAEIRRRLRSPFPTIVFQLGSGLGGVAEQITPSAVIPYEEIPGFPACTVPGHAGRLIVGSLGGVRVACLQGRAHLYEGHDPAALAIPIRTVKALGAKLFVMASAVGGLRSGLTPGSFVLVEDHVNLSGRNPLTGPNDDAVGPRFPDMTNAYDPGLRSALADAARAAGVETTSGVYAYTPGPSFETPAEIRALARLGADVVGMSTVPDCIVARHAGLKVAAIAVVTNLAAGLSAGPITLEEAVAVGEKASRRLSQVLSRFAASADAAG